MPFGLTNAQTTFQSSMKHAFRAQLQKYLLALFDDILIYSKTPEEHLKDLDEVLKILQERSLYVKMSKCEFGMEEIFYLRHIIRVEGVQVHMENFLAILDWPTPNTMTGLKGLLGLCTYYRRYVKGFSQFSAPLIDVTNKGEFTWIEVAQQTFEKMFKES